MTLPFDRPSSADRPERPVTPAAPAAPPPYLAVDTACDGCSGGLVLTGEDAVRVRETAAHRALMAGGLAPTAAERAERAALLARAAAAAGWVRTPAGGWRCRRCRQRYGEAGSPLRFTVREVIARHRTSFVSGPGTSVRAMFSRENISE